MRILGWLLGGVLALVLLLAGIGMVLPASFSIERSIEIRAPAERVHALVASPRQWTRWSAWNARDPDMQIRYSGPESGVGAAWAWRSASEGNGEMEFVAAEPGRGIDYERVKKPRRRSEGVSGRSWQSAVREFKGVWRAK